MPHSTNTFLGQVQVPGICVENGSQYGHFYEPRELVNAYTLTQPEYTSISLTT